MVVVQPQKDPHTAEGDAPGIANRAVDRHAAVRDGSIVLHVLHAQHSRAARGGGSGGRAGKRGERSLRRGLRLRRRHDGRTGPRETAKVAFLRELRERARAVRVRGGDRSRRGEGRRGGRRRRGRRRRRRRRRRGRYLRGKENDHGGEHGPIIRQPRGRRASPRRSSRKDGPSSSKPTARGPAAHARRGPRAASFRAT